MTFDNNVTTVDRKYRFTIAVQDQYAYSRITREFNLQISDPDDKVYSNLYFKPFITNSKKLVFDTFRLIMPLKNCDTPGMTFILQDKVLQWQQGTLYFVDTAKVHYLFNTTPEPAYWLVVNVDVNDETLAGVCQHMKQR